MPAARSGLPLRLYAPRSGMCTSAPTHLFSRSSSEDSAAMEGLVPASVCSTLRCVHLIAYTLDSRSASKDQATSADFKGQKESFQKNTVCKKTHVQSSSILDPMFCPSSLLFLPLDVLALTPSSPNTYPRTYHMCVCTILTYIHT